MAANSQIRNAFEKLCKKNNIRLILPPLNMCGDNAAMIGLACIKKLEKNINPNLYFNEDPRLKIKNVI